MGEGIRWGGEGNGVEVRGGGERREGEGRPPNVRDALTPLTLSRTASFNDSRSKAEAQ